MNKNLAVAASAATLLIFLGAGCSEMPKAEENEKLEKTEQVTETEVKTEPVAEQTAPAAVQKEREEKNENEDEDEREERGTAQTEPQVKPAAPAPAPTTAPTVKTYTMAEVQKANNANNCWSVISGKVYDLTSFTPGHPGGEPAILSMCGKDGTAGFMAQHGGQRKPESVLAKFYLGVLK